MTLDQLQEAKEIENKLKFKEEQIRNIQEEILYYTGNPSYYTIEISGRRGTLALDSGRFMNFLNREVECLSSEINDLITELEKY